MADGISITCYEACWAEEVCAVCHRVKVPVGRDLPMAAGGGYCDGDCRGYGWPKRHLWDEHDKARHYTDPDGWAAHEASCARCGADLIGGETDRQPYADPAFTPGMVVCKADRNRNDLRIWEAFQPEDAEPGEWLFDALWRTTTVRWDKREDLPGQLAVVDGCGFARSGAAGE